VNTISSLARRLIQYTKLQLEIVCTIAAPAFHILFIGCVLNTKIAYTTAEKLTFEAFY